MFPLQQYLFMSGFGTKYLYVAGLHCHKSVHWPKEFDLVHQTVFPCERVGSGDESNSSLQHCVLDEWVQQFNRYITHTIISHRAESRGHRWHSHSWPYYPLLPAHDWPQAIPETPWAGGTSTTQHRAISNPPPSLQLGEWKEYDPRARCADSWSEKSADGRSERTESGSIEIRWHRAV